MKVIKRKTIVVKIGTAALSKEDGTVDKELLGSIVADLVTLKKDGHHVVLVTSGAVGMGRVILPDSSFPDCPDDITRKQIQASVGQPLLMRVYQELLDETASGITVSQILLVKEHFDAPQHLERMLFHILEKRLDILPIMNENDPVAIQELFTDNDELAGYVAKLVHADRLVFLSSIDGIYPCDPKKDPSAERIPYIDASSINRDIDTVGQTEAGRGGMSSKLQSALRAAREGVVVHVASSRVPEVVLRLLQDEPFGTRIDTTQNPIA